MPQQKPPTRANNIRVTDVASSKAFLYHEENVGNTGSDIVTTSSDILTSTNEELKEIHSRVHDTVRQFEKAMAYNSEDEHWYNSDDNSSSDDDDDTNGKNELWQLGEILLSTHESLSNHAGGFSDKEYSQTFSNDVILEKEKHSSDTLSYVRDETKATKGKLGNIFRRTMTFARAMKLEAVSKEDLALSNNEIKVLKKEANDLMTEKLEIKKKAENLSRMYQKAINVVADKDAEIKMLSVKVELADSEHASLKEELARAHENSTARFIDSREQLNTIRDQRDSLLTVNDRLDRQLKKSKKDISELESVISSQKRLIREERTFKDKAILELKATVAMNEKLKKESEDQVDAVTEAKSAVFKEYELQLDDLRLDLLQSSEKLIRSEERIQTQRKRHEFEKGSLQEKIETQAAEIKSLREKNENPRQAVNLFDAKRPVRRKTKFNSRSVSIQTDENNLIVVNEVLPLPVIEHRKHERRSSLEILQNAINNAEIRNSFSGRSSNLPTTLCKSDDNLPDSTAANNSSPVDDNPSQAACTAAAPLAATSSSVVDTPAQLILSEEKPVVKESSVDSTEESTIPLSEVPSENATPIESTEVPPVEKLPNNDEVVSKLIVLSALEDLECQLQEQYEQRIADYDTTIKDILTEQRKSVSDKQELNRLKIELSVLKSTLQEKDSRIAALTEGGGQSRLLLPKAPKTEIRSSQKSPQRQRITTKSKSIEPRTFQYEESNDSQLVPETSQLLEVPEVNTETFDDKKSEERVLQVLSEQQNSNRGHFIPTPHVNAAGMNIKSYVTPVKANTISMEAGFKKVLKQQMKQLSHVKSQLVINRWTCFMHFSRLNHSLKGISTEFDDPKRLEIVRQRAVVRYNGVRNVYYERQKLLIQHQKELWKTCMSTVVHVTNVANSVKENDALKSPTHKLSIKHQGFNVPSEESLNRMRINFMLRGPGILKLDESLNEEAVGAADNLCLKSEQVHRIENIAARLPQDIAALSLQQRQKLIAEIVSYVLHKRDDATDISQSPNKACSDTPYLRRKAKEAKILSNTKSSASRAPSSISGFSADSASHFDIRFKSG